MEKERKDDWDECNDMHAGHCHAVTSMGYQQSITGPVLGPATAVHRPAHCDVEAGTPHKAGGSESRPARSGTRV